jgi:hypothetical protein
MREEKLHGRRREERGNIHNFFSNPISSIPLLQLLPPTNKIRLRIAGV